MYTIKVGLSILVAPPPLKSIYGVGNLIIGIVGFSSL